MEAWTRVVLYIIPLIMLILALWFYFAPEKGFDKLKGIVEGTKDYVPEVPDFSEKVVESQLDVPEDQQAAIQSLKSTINSMLWATNACFAHFSGFPELGSYGTSLEFVYEQGKTTMFVQGGTDGRKDITSLRTELEGMVPCVIAGTTEVTEGFEKYLHKQKTDALFNPVSSIKIAYNEAGLNENRIDYGTGFVDYESQQWLFTPDGKHICFFPTVDGSSDADGLNNDYFGFTEGSATSIPFLYAQQKLPRCEGSIP